MKPVLRGLAFVSTVPQPRWGPDCLVVNHVAAEKVTLNASFASTATKTNSNESVTTASAKKEKQWRMLVGQINMSIPSLVFFGAAMVIKWCTVELTRWLIELDAVFFHCCPSRKCLFTLST